MATSSVEVEAILGDMRVSRYARAMLGLCVLIGMVEGYDAQAMAFAAPMVAEAWSLSSATLGLLLATSIFGMVVGSFLLSPLGDRWGRRPCILAALLVAGLATAAGAAATDPAGLFATRFVAGLGLGLAFPNVIALAMELMPTRLRTLAVVLVACGYPLGGAVGGIAAAGLIADYGYAGVFVLGGSATLVVMLLCAVSLPESPLFLARRGGDIERLRRLLTRLGGNVPSNATSFVSVEAVQPKSSVAALFESQRRFVTALLWTINFANLSLVYYFVTWLPTIIVRNGSSPQFAAGALSLLSISGMVGGLALAFVLPRLGAKRTLAGAYLVAAVSATVLASFTVYGASFLAVLAVAGVAIVGSQFCLTAVVNHYYPSGIRATASGYATGAGRLGAVLAPLAGAAVMSSDGASQAAFAIAVVPALIALGGIVMLRDRAI